MDVTKLPTNTMCVTGNQQRSDKLTVRLNSVVSREVVGNQDLKKVLSDGYWDKLTSVVSSVTNSKHLATNNLKTEKCLPFFNSL